MLCRRANRSEVVNLSVILLFGKLLFVQFCWSPPHGGRELKPRPSAQKARRAKRSPPHGGRELKRRCGARHTLSKRSPPHGGRELETFCVRTPTLSCSFAHTRGRELKLSSEVYDTYHLWSPPHGGRELKRERIDLILNFFSSPPLTGA